MFSKWDTASHTKSLEHLSSGAYEYSVSLSLFSHSLSVSLLHFKSYMMNKEYHFILISCHTTAKSNLSEASKNMFFFLSLRVWKLCHVRGIIQEEEQTWTQKWAFFFYRMLTFLDKKQNSLSNRDILSRWMLTVVTDLWLKITHFSALLCLDLNN